MAHANIYADPEMLLVQPCMGLRRQRSNPNEERHLLERQAAAEEIGSALLDALSRHRRLLPEEIGEFFDLAVVNRDYEAWVAQLRAQYGYKTRKALFQSMRHCTARLDGQVIVLQPTRHEKLEAWSGTEAYGTDQVEIALRSSPSEIGSAVLATLARCE